MPRLEASVAFSFTTDFAMCHVGQPGLGNGPLSMTFAGSAPGEVGLRTGWRYSAVEITLERWDARPPEPDGIWEDQDELPWQSVPDDGPAVAWGFDPPGTGPGLNLDGLDRARVQVLARGRYRYGSYDESWPDGDPEPERWLLRWWPDPERRDALAGPPRRLAGPACFDVRLTPWAAAAKGWSTTGWRARMHGIEGFWALLQGIERAGGPVTVGELAARWPYVDPSAPVYGEPAAHGVPDWMAAQRAERLRPIEEAAAMTISTVEDALTALGRLGLVATTDDGRLVPNPAPLPAWEALQTDGATAAAWRREALGVDGRIYLEDLRHMVRWAPDGQLRTTLGAAAVRLAIRPENLLDALNYAEAMGAVELETDEEPGISSPMVVRHLGAWL